MPRLSVPTTARLPSSLRVDPSHPTATKILGRLSRSSLLTVALDWLDDSNLPLAQPFLRGDEEYEEELEDEDADGLYPPARSVEEVRDVYSSFQGRKGSKREVLERITDGDWRHGLTLYQLAMADLQYLYDHPTSQQWSAYRVVPLKPPRDPEGEEALEVDKQSLAIPRFHPSTFLKTLQAQVLPDVKAHYNFDAHKSLPLLLLRIFILDSPYSTNLGLQTTTTGTTTTTTTTGFDASRTVYIAFPDASPHIFISKPQTTTTTTTTTTITLSSSSSYSSSSGPSGGGGGESKSLRTLLLEGIPKALSRPLQRQRFTLQATKLVTRNLAELVARRGGGRTNAAAGGWSVYADDDEKDPKRKNETPLDLVLPLPVSPPLSSSSAASSFLEEGEDEGGKKRAVVVGPLPLSAGERREERVRKRARLVAQARFGDTAKVGDGKGVERVDVVLEDAFPQGPGESVAVEEEEEQDETYDRDRAGRSARAGRKSQVDAALERAEEEEDDDDDDEGGGGRREEQPAQVWRPNVRLTFHGSHVFAGIRQLVECGIIDGERMPGWMTGEEGVTIGAVRHGRIRGHKGSGL
ncbi:centromere protein Chl4/mis15/CENP-N [Chaetomium strumarium]|uniref:Centromere protein Chl4/mis15/CENP-N n=1 Tax=Chaetomium strumarium TaxID=1170767 RepID=A0AAJ0M026_9PEZI|nr:centromere protein Chl4/mis15/CENP-N [Chaetomium strumarium]